ncbi:hypothetical protein ACFL31_05210 [Candidatus Margulisiibacteriota bacterium]
MITKIICCGLIFFFAGGTALAASTSSSYKMTTQIIGVGAGSGTSTSYSLRGVARETGIGIPTGTSYIIGAGFMKSAYFGAAVILTPIITSVETGVLTDNGMLPVTIYGANFDEGATTALSLQGEVTISGSSVTVENSTKITCEFYVAAAKGGYWTVSVTNLDAQSGSLPSAVRLYDAPEISSIVPIKSYNDQVVPVEIAGTGFRAGAAVSLALSGEDDIVGTSVSISASKITCNFDIINKTTGRWDVIVQNTDGRAGTLSEGFKIEKPILTIDEPLEIEITPNPAAPSIKATKIQYKMTKDAEIVINIYNMRGEKIWTYLAPPGTEGGQAGVNQVVWDGLTAFKSVASSGVYIIHVTSKVDGQIKILRKQKIGIIK